MNNDRYEGLRKRTEEVGILEVGNEKITTGKLTLVEEEISDFEIPFDVSFTEQTKSVLPTLELTTNEGNSIKLYFTNENIFIDVNDRRQYKKLNMSKLFLYKDEILVGGQLDFEFNQTSNFELIHNDESKSWAGMHILTNYGTFINIIIDKHKVESTISGRVNKTNTLGAFILCELVYSNIVFFDENEK